RRLVEEQDARLALEAAREEQLLLVAPRERLDRRVPARVDDPLLPDPTLERGALGAAVEDAEEASRARQEQVLAQRAAGEQPLPRAVLEIGSASCRERV